MRVDIELLKYQGLVDKWNRRAEKLEAVRPLKAKIARLCGIALGDEIRAIAKDVAENPNDWKLDLNL